MLRVPSNTHPSHLYGATNTAAEFSAIDEEVASTSGESINSYDELFYSAQGTPISRPQSIRASIQNFAGSYSRASILYVADTISIHQGYDEDQLPQHQALLSKSKTRESYLDDDKVLLHRTKTTPPIFYATEPLSRPTTISSILLSQHHNQKPEEVYCNKSNFVQSVFNAVNVLVGVGILALPLSMRLAGWFYGSLIFIFCCLATNYTAKIIIKCLNTNANHGTTYGDMGQIAFEDRGRKWISIIFIIELITIGVAMIVLLGDGIQSLFPHLDVVKTRVISLIILTPTVFLPIKRLAYTSLIGIIGCISLVIIVLYDGFTKPTRPGSLFDPMDTEIIPSDLSHLPLSFGLIMSGFAGHAVFPSIYRNMENPKQYNQMVNITYQITVVTYLIMAVVGYLMFGQEVLQEITQNLVLIDEYSQLLNRFAIWLLVLTPIAKYGLMMQPLNLSWELWLFDKYEPSHQRQRTILTVVGRLTITSLLVYIALIFPGFDKVMSLLGALFSFSISIIFPIVCHLKLFRAKLSLSETILNWFILFTAVLMAIFGTIWSVGPISEL
ncbi:MAG: transmembrane amino acid transporter protein-domain-containing protein [Benjaminiella poitrasii]|nr:MAG: transmembrane amino acid transporter protein-domain-containing protein [Benjaminiella poitrasii]